MTPAARLMFEELTWLAANVAVRPPGQVVTAVSINAPCTPSSDSTAGHDPASSTHPIHETSGSPAGECGQGCRVDR